MVQLVQHQGLESAWSSYPLPFQMANIGSEVSRALKNQDKPNRFRGAYERALELFDLTMDVLVSQLRFGALQEVCRAREEFCDYFNGNSLKTNPQKMQKYYDQFATLERRNIP